MLINYVEQASAQSFTDSLVDDVIIRLSKELHLGLPKASLQPAAISVLQDGSLSFDRLRALTPSAVSGSIALAATRKMKFGTLGAVPMLCNIHNDCTFLANVSLAQQLVLRNHRGPRVRASDTIHLLDAARYYSTTAARWDATDIETLAMFVGSLDVADGDTTLATVDVSGRTDVNADALLWAGASISTQTTLFSNIAFHTSGLLVAPITRIFGIALISGNLYCSGMTSMPDNVSASVLRVSHSIRASEPCVISNASAISTKSASMTVIDRAQVRGVTSTGRGIVASNLAVVNPGPDSGDTVTFKNKTVTTSSWQVTGNACIAAYGQSAPLVSATGSMHLGNTGISAQALHISVHANVLVQDCTVASGNVEMMTATTVDIANAKIMHLTATDSTVVANARIDTAQVSTVSTNLLFAHPTCLIRATGATRIEEMVHAPGPTPAFVRDMRPDLLLVEGAVKVANGPCSVRGDAVISNNAAFASDVLANANVICFDDLTMSNARVNKDAVLASNFYATDVVCGQTTVYGNEVLVANAAFGAINLATQGSLERTIVGQALIVQKELVCSELIANNATCTGNLWVLRDGTANAVSVATNANVAERANIHDMDVDQAYASSAQFDHVDVSNVATPQMVCIDAASNAAQIQSLLATTMNSNTVFATRSAQLETTLQASGDMGLLLAAQAKATIRGSTAVYGPMHVTGKAEVATAVSMTRAGLRVVGAAAQLATASVTGCVQVNNFVTPELQANTLYCGDRVKVTSDLICTAPEAAVTSVVFGADLQSGPLSLIGNVVARDLSCASLSSGNMSAATASMGATVCRLLQCDTLQMPSVVTPPTSRATITTSFDARQSDAKFECNVTVNNTMTVNRVENVGSFVIRSTSSTLVSTLKVQAATRTTTTYISSGSDAIRFRSSAGVIDLGLGSGGSHSSVMYVTSAGATLRPGKDLMTPACPSARDLAEKYYNGTIVSTDRLDTSLSIFKDAYPLAYYGTFDDLVDAPYIMDVQFIMYIPALQTAEARTVLGPITGENCWKLGSMQTTFKATHIAIHNKQTSKTSLRRIMKFTFTEIPEAMISVFLEYPFDSNLAMTNVELMFVTLVNKGFLLLQSGVTATLSNQTPFYDFSKATPVHSVYSFAPTVAMPAGGRYFLQVGSRYAPIVLPLNASTNLAYAIVPSGTPVPTQVTGMLVLQTAYNQDIAYSYSTIWPQDYSDRAILYSYSSWSRIVFYYRHLTSFYNRMLNDNFGCQKTFPAYAYIPQSTDIPVFQEGDSRTMKSNRLQLIPVDIPLGPAQTTTQFSINNKTATVYAGTFNGRPIVNHFTTKNIRNVSIDGDTLKPVYRGSAFIDNINKAYDSLYNTGEYFVDAAGAVFASITESAYMIPWHNSVRYEQGKYIFSPATATATPFLAINTGKVAVDKKGGSATFVRCDKFIYHRISVASSSTILVEVDMNLFLQNPIKLKRFFAFFEYDPAALLGEVLLKSIGSYVAVPGKQSTYEAQPTVEDSDGGVTFDEYMDGKRVTLDANTGTYSIATVDSNAASNIASTSISTSVAFTVFGINVVMDGNILTQTANVGSLGATVPADFRKMIASPAFQIVPRTSGTGAPFSLRVQRSDNTVVMYVGDVDGMLPDFTVNLTVSSVSGESTVYEFFGPTPKVFIYAAHNPNYDDFLFQTDLPADRFSYVITNTGQPAAVADYKPAKPLIHLTSVSFYLSGSGPALNASNGSVGEVSLIMGTDVGAYARWFSDPTKIFEFTDTNPGTTSITSYEYEQLSGSDVQYDFNGDGNKGPVFFRLRRVSNNTSLLSRDQRRAFGVLKHIVIPPFTKVTLEFFNTRTQNLGVTSGTTPTSPLQVSYLNGTATAQLQTLSYKRYDELNQPAFAPVTPDYPGQLGKLLYHGWVPKKATVTNLL